MLKVWDLRTGKEMAAFSGDRPFNCAGFSPDNTIIAAGDQSGRVHFYYLSGEIAIESNPIFKIISNKFILLI